MLGFVTFLAVIGLCFSEVVVLNNANFESLTQASTGATTGDWLVKFYAPWCGHCRKLEPTYEKVADILEGKVNVAKVDVPASRELGTRFDIKGFPTIKLISKGKVYTYKGRRTAEDIAEFAQGGFAIHEAEDVAPPMGMLGEITHVYRLAYKKASDDLAKGNYFSVDVFLTFLPVFFIIVIVLLLLAPSPAPKRPRHRASPSEEEEEEEDDADSGIPPSPVREKVE